MIVGVIPARFGSTRFPGKPLALIQNKPMILHVYQRALAANCFDELIVATDHPDILNTVIAAGGKAFLTPSQIGSGTERVWLTVRDLPAKIIVNIQGDEPLISPDLLSELCNKLKSENYPVITPIRKNFNYQDFSSAHVVKVIIDNKFNALYFSRAPIPAHFNNASFSFFWQHIGIYGFQKPSLESFCQLPQGNLEKLENLEQLRFLENGIPIHCLPTEYNSISVDNPEDILKVEEKLIKGNNNEK